MKKKILVLVAALSACMVLGVFAGCDGGTTSDSSSSSDSSVSDSSSDEDSSAE